jgi:hypothetical protein
MTINQIIEHNHHKKKNNTDNDEVNIWEKRIKYKGITFAEKNARKKYMKYNKNYKKKGLYHWCLGAHDPIQLQKYKKRQISMYYIYNI